MWHLKHYLCTFVYIENLFSLRVHRVLRALCIVAANGTVAANKCEPLMNLYEITFCINIVFFYVFAHDFINTHTHQRWIQNTLLYCLYPCLCLQKEIFSYKSWGINKVDISCYIRLIWIRSETKVIK